MVPPEDKGLRLALGRYLDVVAGKKPVLFQLCRAVEVEKGKAAQDMWEQHAKGLKALAELKRNSAVEELPRPSYSLLDLKIELAERNVRACTLCERMCMANRKEGKLGFCGVGYESRVASAFAHIGEEPEFIPSGTIFFSGCNSRCVFCQNWDISQFPQAGGIWSPKMIADWIDVRASTRSIINVNLVGGEPTPNTHNILKALKLVKSDIPLIWNSNMYMSEECMRLLDGVIDVYLSDFKYGNDKCAMRLSSLPRYFEVVSRNHLLAAKQTEMLIRHLVMPNHTECDSKLILEWIKKNLGDKVRVNIMSQYRPEYKAHEFPDIARRLHFDEYNDVIKHAKEIGLWNVELQVM